VTLQYPVESVVDRNDVGSICIGIYPLGDLEYKGSNTGKKGVERVIKGGTDKEDFCQLLLLQTARRLTL